MAQGIREILDAREREVLRSLDDLKRKQVQPLERELSEIRAARAAIISVASHNDLVDAFENGGEADQAVQRMTHKELATKTLREHFKNGATITEMIQFFRREWGREISKGSFSPQLSRMKQEGLVKQVGKTWIWNEFFDL